ncbi:serine/threonine-protein kinase [Nonomuraea thailandensis]
MPEPMSLLPEDPVEVGPYRLEGRLGSGGQGVVYTGRGPGGVLVAVKLLHSHLIADDAARIRFLREVQTAKRVAPFCTAQLLDSGFVGARPYIVSEYVHGPSLQDSVRESGPRGAAALQRLAINTATALAAIHAAGVVHRDFKPGNVLLGPDGPVVIDFGIAKALDVSQSVASSQPIGSPAYMAPEQIADEDVGPAADLFAWAATMYYAATGRRAFPGDSIPAALHSVLNSEPDLGGVDGRLRRLLEECLAKDQTRRPTAAQVVERLRALPTPTWQAAADGPVGGAFAGHSTNGHVATQEALAGRPLAVVCSPSPRRVRP